MRLAAFLLVLFCIVSVQGAPLGNETALTSQATNKRADQQQLVFNRGTGLFLNVYIETTIVPGQPDQTSVMGQILSTEGNLVIKSFAIWSWAANPEAQGRKSHPSAAFSDQDSIFFVAFEMEKGGVPGLYGTFVSGDGLPRNYIFPLTNDTRPCVSPVVAYNSISNEFGVVWQVDEIINTNTSTFATSYFNMLTLNSTNFLAPIVVFGVPNYHNSYPFITYVETSDLYLIIWSAADPTTDGIHDLYSTTVGSSAGALFTSPPIQVVGVVEVNDTTGQGTHADSLYSYLIPFGGYYNLMWQVNGASGQQYTAAMYIDNGGIMASGLVSIGANYFYTRRPVGVYSTQASIFVVLHEAGSSDSSMNIIGITLDTNLNVLAYYSINSLYINNDHFPAMAGDALNNNLAVWSHGTVPTPPPTTNTTGRSFEEEDIPLEKFKEMKISMGASKSELQARSKNLPFFSSADESSSPSFTPISSVAIQSSSSSSSDEQEKGFEEFDSDEKEERASPPPPPSGFLVGNPILVIPSSTSGSSGGGSKSSGSGWVGGLVAIILILIAIFVTSLVIIALLGYIVYKYRDQIGAKMANLKLPSIPGRGSFQQFTDEDELA